MKPIKPEIVTDEKSGLHPRNKHRANYNFDQLIIACPELKPFVIINKYNTITIDFKNEVAIRFLNKALLKHFYNIPFWDIPSDYLCPPIPGRVDYIHNIADVLGQSNGGKIPNGKSIRVLDIGMGANCIYPLLGHQEYGWSFVGTDIDPISLKVANQIIKSNSLSNAIDCRHQPHTEFIFKGIIKPQEFFDVTICNPPFHSSIEEANSGSERKWKNLGYKKTNKPLLNFGGQHNELWCKGGEVAFINKIIEESVQIKDQCLWFTSLVSKNTSLPSIYFSLKKVGAITVKTINMNQGNKISRLVAWTFFSDTEQMNWSLKRWGNLSK